MGLRGPLFLFLECSPETVCSAAAAARKSRKTERLFLGKTDGPHSCCQSFLPLLLSPFLAMAVWGQWTEGGGGHGERGEQWGVGKVTENRRGEREERGVQETKRISDTKRFIIPPRVALFWLLMLCSSPLQCSSQSTSQSDHESPPAHLHAR